jgi:hypothetical protein
MSSGFLEGLAKLKLPYKAKLNLPYKAKLEKLIVTYK